MSVISNTLYAETARFSRFCVIGGVGFLIDAAVLTALIFSVNLDPLLARLISILVAVTACWALHRLWTFQSRDKRRLREWSRFVLVNSVGASVNYLVYAAILVITPVDSPLFALAIGSIAALAFNYLGARFFAFEIIATRS